jgi:D-serine dehydratase
MKKQPLNYLTKGLPAQAEQKWNVLCDALPFPLLVLKDSVLEKNIQTMAQWCAANGFLLAPHGKTTMCPQIFQRQLDAGAWAMTVATASQAKVASHFGVRRILMANQLVGKANIALVVNEINQNSDLEFYCILDSVEGVNHLAKHLHTFKPDRPLKVLLEWGKNDWRTGVSTIEQAKEVMRSLLEHQNNLSFAGFEGFEGMAGVTEGKEAEVRSVQDFLASLIEMADSMNAVQPKNNDPLVLSIGGSAYLDLVGESCRSLSDRFKIVIRSGCYITHDHGYYAEKLGEAQDRVEAGKNLLSFQPALELWALVQSLPQAGQAILTFGKRDCSYDLGLPKPLYALPEGESLKSKRSLDQARITDTNDQHAFLTYPESVSLQVGDRVVCGISHPCTAFDKWRMIPLVDDSYNVIDWYQTYF